MELQAYMVHGDRIINRLPQRAAFEAPRNDKRMLLQRSVTANAVFQSQNRQKSFIFLNAFRRKSCGCCMAAFPNQSLCKRSIGIIFGSSKGAGPSGNGAEARPKTVKGYIMAVIAQSHHAAASTGIAGRLLAAIQHMQENRARRAIYRQTVRELNALTNRDLADLGISRAMIGRLAHEAAWGPK